MMVYCVLRRTLASLAVVIGLLLIPALMPAPANAVTVNINTGTNLNYGRRITCAQGERLLRNRGFRNVRRVDCRGRHFAYRGWRGRNRYEVTVRSHDGRVVGRRRIRS